MNAFRPRPNPLILGLLVSLLVCPTAAQTCAEWMARGERDTVATRAIEAYGRVIAQCPESSAEALFGRGIVFTQLRQYEKALEDLNRAVRRKATDPRFFGQRGYIFVQLSEYDRAIADYQQALQLAPDSADYLSGLSYCLTKHDRYAEAEQVAQRGIELAPNSPYSYRNRGRARLYQGQVDAAITDFTRSLTLHHAEAYRVLCDLGEAYEKKQELTQALVYYRQALAQRADYVEALVRERKLALRLLGQGAVRPEGSPQSTFVGKRIALVVGNSGYRHASPLQGQPVQDAQAMQTRLGELGFQVTCVTDVGYAALRKALDQFYVDARNADVAWLFYAGHGVQYRGTNYLLPIDTELREDSLTHRTFSLPTIIEVLQKQQARYCVVVLDACRDDPFAEASPPAAPVRPDSVGRSVAVSVGVSRGFRPVRVENLVRNCLVALATASGSVARNGPRQNGYYTEAMLRHLRRNREISEVFLDVRREVIAETQKAGTLQQPEFINQAVERMIL
jgi:tetratricopeptide (TPR) repeat protein